jgi:uncharacterized Zn-binding protein involved in type VI secretion
MPAAARFGDLHSCPVHGGGVIIPPTSLDTVTGARQQARVGDRIACPYGPPDFIVTGSACAFVNGLMAARMGDKTMHGGVLITGALDVEIGGPSAGASLGAPAAWLQTFNDAALGRTSNSAQQSYSNCGIESTRQLILASGKHVDENQLFDWAIANEHAVRDSKGRRESGGTYPEDWRAIAASQGVALHLEKQTPEAIQQAVAEKRGVITAHDAGKLWGRPEVSGGHAITVTGVEYDANGKPTRYITDDTGLGEGGRPISAEKFEASLIQDYDMGVSDNPLK